MNNTLITGAGSSIDVSSCFLGGSDLLADIIRSLKSREYREQLAGRETAHGLITNEMIDHMLTQILTFRSDKEHNDKKTIDEFLSQVMAYQEYDAHRDLLVRIGKYSIFYSIMKMENRFRSATSIQETGLTNWINLIKNDFHSGNLTNIITFNYDRLIEHSLGIGKSKRVQHVYGTVNLDDWAFGKLPENITEIDHLLDHFKIQHDNVPHEQDITFGKSGISHIYNSLGANCFLMGFGFDLFNVKNLGLMNNLNKHVYGNIFEDTGHRVNFKKKRKRSEHIRRLVPVIRLHYLSCNEFIQLMNQIRPSG